MKRSSLVQTSGRSDWLIGGGETGEWIRSIDWSNTSLGTREAWPQSLRTMVNVVLASSLPMAVLWGRDLNLIYNDAYRGIAGGRHPGALGRPVAEALLEAMEPVVVERVKSGGETVHLARQVVRIRRQGAEADIDFAVSYTPIRGEDDSVAGVLATMVEHGEAVDRGGAVDEPGRPKALHDNEELFRIFLRQSRDGIIIIDSQGRILEWSDGEEVITGIPRSEALGQPLWEIQYRLAPDERKSATFVPAAQGKIFNGFKEGTELRRDLEDEIQRPDGSRRIVHSSLFAIRSGQEFVACGICRDVTGRKEAEKALETARQSLERERNLLQAVMNGARNSHLVYLDREFNFVCVNDTYARGCGYTPGQMIGKNHFALYPHAENEAIFRRVCETGQPVEYHDKPFEFPDQPERGITYWDWTLEPVKDAAGEVQGLVFSLHETTARKRAEEEMKAAKLAAEQAKAAAEAANNAKGHFLAVLSHELRNPLSPVLTAASMLCDDPRFDADVREQLEIICRNAELEARLIDDLLDVTRIERGKVALDRRPVELCTILHRAMEVCRADIEARDLHVGLDLEPGQYWVDADAARMQQVFWNLIKNAIKFTPHGGTVGIRCRKNGGGSVVAEVADSGIGIEPEMMPRLFTAFEQAECGITRQFGGLGLGLAISKAMVELHGGSIEARSEGRGKGATFTVRLPLLAEAAAPVATSSVSQRLPTETSGPLRILLVEDHGDTARVMRRLLTAEGHEVETAGDTIAAMALAEKREFDLLLSDLGLPDGSGLDLLRALRAKRIDVPAIAMSGYGQEKDVQQSREAGFVAHLVKPVSLPKLEEAIRRAVKRLS